MIKNLVKRYPPEILQAISRVASDLRVEVYVVGGTVRDWMSGIEPRDLDLAVSGHALEFCRILARDISGTFVLLDSDEQTARVAWKGHDIDVALFRSGAREIEDDLVKRDFTINAMAFPFDLSLMEHARIEAVIDPSGGRHDLQQKIIRVLHPSSFVDDPLRILRAFRFFAETGFVIEDKTWKAITDYRQLLSSVSPERISYELHCIMGSKQSYHAFWELKKSGVLGDLFPELMLGAGLDQPSSHHLDVFQHNLEALRWMEVIVKNPAQFYPHQAELIETYLADDKRRLQLKWASLFHDLGKPAVSRIRDERITFYNHDQVGAALFKELARRLRWSNEIVERISRFISLHMWPFHLSNEQRKKGVTPRACLKLYKSAGQELPGLFLLAMADSLAGQGPGKPKEMENELRTLYDQVVAVCKKHVEPVLSAPRLVTGKDLIGMGLTPGPFFKDIFNMLEKAQVEGIIKNRKQAMELVEDFCANL
ncbi:MAG: HDIG domain-containing protein [Desulfobulbaceae bacterium]|nr:HDIG domain-containing protein [Desulfobulbaceae bacterium]